MASPFITLAHQNKSQGITVNSHNGAIANPLPKRYAAKIATLPMARGITYGDLDIIPCGGSGFNVTLNAYGGPGTIEALQQMGYSRAQIQAFQKDPLAALTDSKTAARCDWHVGQGITPKTVFGKSIELHITDIIPATDHGGAAIVHYAYLNRVAGVTKRDMVTQIDLHAADPRDNDALAAHIQAMFAHANPPVQATPNTVTQNALARFGKVQYLLAFVMLAIFACCALVLTSVMAHATAQRRAQMAMLQVLGFPRTVHWAALALEVVLMLALGAAIGFGVGHLAIHILQRTLGGTFQSIAAPSSTVTLLWPGLCLLLIVSLIVPSVIIARLRPTDCRDL